jgi:Fe2+ or Zn2+ uptake regulation protein
MENSPADIQSWSERLRKSGYRLTAPRRAIVELLSASSQALSPIEVYDLGRQVFPGLGLVTVYRTLEKLEQLGLVQRVHMPDGCHRYLREAEGHQHILLCMGCGQVALFGGDDLLTLTEQVEKDTGYTVSGHWLQLLGTCPQCSR